MDHWLLIVPLIAVLVLARVSYGWHRQYTDLKPSVELTQTVLAILGIALAGYWYFIERKGVPHADIAQKLEIMPIQPGLVAVESHLTIKNLGSRLLKLTEADIRLQQVSPPRMLPYEELQKLSAERYFTAAVRSDGELTRLFDQGELKWPTLKWYSGRIDRHIEPGETDLVVTTFLVRCDLRIVRVAAYLEKSRKLAWSAASSADLAPACAASRGDQSDGGRTK